MQFVAVLTRNPSFAPEEFTPHLPAEVRRATELYAAGTVRQILSRTDGRGAILVLEAADEAAASAAIRSLPLVAKDMLSVELYGVGPYRGFITSLAGPTR
jgi:hypothetical protein